MMPLYLPKSEGSSFELPPAGMHPAYCYRLIDLGTHDEPYQGVPNVGRRLLIGWELAIDERMADERPFAVFRRWKYSSHEKARMRIDLEAWMGRKFRDDDFGTFDLANIVEQKCMLNIQLAENDGKEYANIAGIGPAMRGLKFPPMHNEPQVLVLDKHSFDGDVFEALSENLKGKIMQSPEYAAIFGQQKPAKQQRQDTDTWKAPKLAPGVGREPAQLGQARPGQPRPSLHSFGKSASPAPRPLSEGEPDEEPSPGRPVPRVPGDGAPGYWKAAHEAGREAFFDGKPRRPLPKEYRGPENREAADEWLAGFDAGREEKEESGSD
jgi:hypothetical protein